VGHELAGNLAECYICHRRFGSHSISIQHSALSSWDLRRQSRTSGTCGCGKRHIPWTLSSYRANNTFPKAETYGLTIQIRRCAALDPRQHCGGLRQTRQWRVSAFLNIACGSASELEYHFLLARDLTFLSDLDYQQLNHGVVGVKRVLASLAAK